jgi:putative peptide zinc metalloprotease protein
MSGSRKPEDDLGRDLEFEEYGPQLRRLTPKLRHDARIVPQSFRGEQWYVLQDPITLQFYRVGKNEREILDRLDGRTTLGEIHEALKAKLGAQAPSFRDLAQFAFMLRHANLTTPEGADESKWHVERAAKKRRQRAVARWANFMYATIPLLDPDRFLQDTMGAVRWVFSRWVFVLWALVVGAAAVAMAYNLRALAQPANSVLAPENLIYLYAAFVLVKALHEFGHAYAARRYGVEVHRMGIMLVIFMPMPYVDVTPAWGLQSKWQKIVIGASGMMTELFIASLALFAWLALEPGALRSVCYDVIFVASVSSILFNGNPLLRYDAYYILADLIEIPNLRQRSSKYIGDLLKKHVVGAQVTLTPATARERAWYVGYGLLAMVYRTIIAVGIILFIASQLFVLGLLIAAVVAVMWLVTPVVKMVKYCLFDAATRPVRWRAAGVLAAGTAVVAALLVATPFTEGVRCPCVLEPAEMSVLRAEWPGLVAEVRVKDGERVAKGQALAVLANETLEYQIADLEARIRGSEARLRMLEAQDQGAAQAERVRLGGLRKDMETLRARHAALLFRAPFDGRVDAPELDEVRGKYLQLGDPFCRVASLDRLRVCVVVETTDMAAIRATADGVVRIKFRSDPAKVYEGKVERVHPSATFTPPEASLTDAAGGPVLMDPKAQDRTLMPWYRVDVILNEGTAGLPPGTTGKARFVVGNDPIGVQLWREFRRMVSRRFLI